MNQHFNIIGILHKLSVNPLLPYIIALFAISNVLLANVLSPYIRYSSQLIKLTYLCFSAGSFLYLLFISARLSRRNNFDAIMFFIAALFALLLLGFAGAQMNK